jgi:di/tricarboxylate transporter
MSDQTITLLILVISVVIFVLNRLPVGVVALGVALALWATGVLSIDQAVAGFGSPTVVLIAALFVVAEALDAAGITTWAGQQLINHAGESRARLIVFVMVIVAILSALITPNGSVAAMVPMVVVLAIRVGRSPSKLLMPLAFAAHAGSQLVLTGSPVNVLISNAADDATGKGFAFFDFALVGIPLLIGTILVTVFLGERLLPERGAKSFSRDLSGLPKALIKQYIQNEEFARLEIEAGSRFDGMPVSKINTGALDSDLHLISVQDSQARPRNDDVARAGDMLVVRGSIESFERFSTRNKLLLRRSEDGSLIECGLVSRQFGVSEVIISPRSNYIGDKAFPGMVTDSGSLVILAVQRHGVDLGTDEIELRAGDSLLLQGGWDALDEHTLDPNVLLVDSPDAIRRQTVPLGPKAKAALIVLAAMVGLLTTGLLPAVAVCMMAAIAMVLLRVVTIDQAHRSMSWTTLILVAGMIPLSTAITQTGAAETLAHHFVDIVGGHGSYVLLLGLFLIAAILGQLISNTATALILIPISISVAAEMSVSPMAVLMCINVACAASLLTPVATPANTMVMGPGGYKFGDYWKLGLPILGVYLLVAVFVVPIFWPL